VPKIFPQFSGILFSASKLGHYVVSNFTFKTKEEALNRSVSLMRTKRHQMHDAYYKEISDEILKYNHVPMFGPTNVEIELRNFLKEDLNFKDIKIDVESADKMTKNQQDAFAKKHFENE
jgi:hypothetical protein